MSSQVKALGRLTAIYHLMEYAHGVALDQARATLHGVEQRIGERSRAAARLEVVGTQALEVGDSDEWRIDQSQAEFLKWNSKTLEAIRQNHEAAMRQAADTYQASRMHLEKMQSVLGEARKRAALESQRTEQRVSDDRYLSRLSWETRANTRQRLGTEQIETFPDAERFDRNG